jgi:AcrR family transcriptional regulator
MAKRKRNDRVREARAELYRGLIREAAERVFAAHGFVGARVEEIAREAGLSVGTIYRVFPGKKQEIYRAIQEQRGTELLGRTRATGMAAWQQRGNVLDAILASVVSFVDYFVAHPEYLRVVLREERAWGVGPARASVEQTVMWREGIEGAVLAMRQGIADGLLVDGDPNLMARSWVALQQAHLGHWLEQGQQADAAVVARQLQEQFLRAFCRPEVLAARGVDEKERGR